jgi:hypothetical protein
MKSRSGNAATIRTAANISAVCSSDKSVLPAEIVTGDAPSFHPMPIFSRSTETPTERCAYAVNFPRAIRARKNVVTPWTIPLSA